LRSFSPILLSTRPSALTTNSSAPAAAATSDCLKQLSQVAGANPTIAPAPDATSAGEASPPTLAPPAAEATSATSDDACKTDEERLAKLQANPSVDQATRLEGELTCAKLQPQLLAILDGLSKSLRSAGAQAPDRALPSPPAAGANSASEAAPPASEATSGVARDKASAIAKTEAYAVA
jgi:hypothetical protein